MTVKGNSCCLYADEYEKRLLLTLDSRFISTYWSQHRNEEMLCILLPRLLDQRFFPQPPDKQCCRLPQAWQDQIVTKFERLEIAPFPESGPYDKDPQVWRDRCLPKYSSLLRLLELVEVHPATKARIAELLLRKLKLALRPSSTLATDEVHFIVSQGFYAYIRLSKTAGILDTSLHPLLRAALPRFARSVGFLHAYLLYIQSGGLVETSEHMKGDSSDDSITEKDGTVESLQTNLRSPSHELRLASLQVLRHLTNDVEVLSVLDTMVEIAETPLALGHTRDFGMLLRRLEQQYTSHRQLGWLQIGVPSFCFGMLTIKLSPVWADAIETLKHLAQTSDGEEIVSAIAFEWIETSPTRDASSGATSHGRSAMLRSDFECISVNRLEEQARIIYASVHNPDESMLREFDEMQHTSPAVPDIARTQALKVFNAMSNIAERRSRRLVPLLLKLINDDNYGVDDDANNASPVADNTPHSWSPADRKSLVGVFAQFVNPRVLYRHEAVYQALLILLGNGDAELQKHALKAILAWKQEGVKPYQENLEYLLDEARFRNELTVFLQGDVVKSEHRSELVPVLLRLLYGRAIAKKGAASGRQGLHATRLAIIRNLSVDELGDFLNILLGKLHGISILGPLTHRMKVLSQTAIAPRKLVGFLNMTSSLITELGANVAVYIEKLLNAVLFCLVYACRYLARFAKDSEPVEAVEEEQQSSELSLCRVIRATGLKCVIALFQNAQSFEWDPYQDVVAEEVIAPRLANLPADTTQGVSGMLHLFSTWSALPKAALFLAPSLTLPDGILPKCLECLGVEKVKGEVKLCILDMIQNIVKLTTAPSAECEFNEVIGAELLDPNYAAILRGIECVLSESTSNGELLESCIDTLLHCAPLLHEEEHIKAVLRLSTYLLKQPPRRVSPKAKGRILLIVEKFVTASEILQDEEVLSDIYDTLSSLFSYFTDKENRQALSRSLLVVSKGRQFSTQSAQLCIELNSFKDGRINEPDYDRRLKALNTICASREVPFTPQQWLPLFHNAIFYVRADEEFGILSSNSADAIRRMIQDCATCEDEITKAIFERYLADTLMPSLYSGAREPSETVRRECLRILGCLLALMPKWSTVADLGGLLNDVLDQSTEPTFFFNILSPALALQIEAMKSLENANLRSEMSSQNLGQFFLPLLEHFIFGRAVGVDDRGLGAQAISTIGALSVSLSWKHYRTTLQRYISYIKTKPELQKQTIRLLSKFTDALATSLSEKKQRDGDDAMQNGDNSVPSQRLSLTVPGQAELIVEVLDNLLPPLVQHMHEKDESEVSYRVPVGIVVVKLLKLLPPETLEQKLAGVLTDICYILRSKAEESRDMARDTLVDICGILGASYFGFILKQMRSALTRGYMLHVLSFTMHSMLVMAAPRLVPGDLDYCLPSIVTVIMDDVFGAVGQEKDANGYTTQMKEIKSSKSQDSMELIARVSSVGHLIYLVKPLQALLMQRVDLKVARKIDTLMGRAAAGLQQNVAADSRDILVFCYEVVQNFIDSQKPEVEVKVDPRVKKYLVQRGASRGGHRGRTAKHTHKLVRFAVDILRSVLRKHDNLRTPENLAGFVPMLKDAISDGEDEVRTSVFRLLAVIVQVPFAERDGRGIFKAAVKETTRAISTAASTTTELSQAALKYLAAVLKNRREIIVKDAAIDMLLGVLKNDLTEPLYRHVTFNFLRAVLDRGSETALVYDTMDYVGTIMIVNDDKETRDLARGAFFQFVREYPQKQARWAKQINFIIANLQYDREGGRISVMEMIHLLLLKSSDGFAQEVATTCFLPLFLVLANDESDKCRESASALIKEIFQVAERDRVKGMLDLLRPWLNKSDAVQVLALRTYGYYFESREDSQKNTRDFELVFAKVREVLCVDDVRLLDEDLAHTVLLVTSSLATVSSDKILGDGTSDLWESICRCIGYPSSKVKLAAIRLFSLQLSDLAKPDRSKSNDGPTGEIFGSRLKAEIVSSLVRRTLGAVAHSEDEDVSSEAGQILIFLGVRLGEGFAVDDEGAEPASVLEAIENRESEDDREDEQPEGAQQLFWRLSHILRKQVKPTAPGILCKTTAMEVLETLCRRSAIERLRPSLKVILVPLANLSDPAIPTPFSSDETFKTKHEALKTRVQILMDSLQKRFGTAEYSQAVLSVREEIRNRRQQRLSKRRIEAISHPEKYGRDKRKKFDKNKERRKVRSKEQKVMRQTYKTW